MAGRDRCDGCHARLSAAAQARDTDRPTRRPGDAKSAKRSLVANGFGFGLADMRTISEKSMNGKPLIFIQLQTSVPPLHLALATSRATFVSRKIQGFGDHCLQAAEANRLPGLVA